MALNFTKITDELIQAVTLEDLANALGVSVQAVRQARASETSTAYRKPPDGWEAAVGKLAAKQAVRFQRLAGRLKGEDGL